MVKQVFFIPHGGGPLPLMGDDGHKGLIALLRSLEDHVADSRAIVVVTAHWEAECAHFSGAATPSLLFDYYNFPPETYEYKYPAPGAPDLARQACALLSESGLNSHIDPERGFDHGAFVPMMLIRPAADIPILQVSVLASLDPADHITLGRSLAPLLDRGVTFIGSGLSFHNLGVLLGGRPETGGQDEAFDTWLNDTIVGPELSEAQRMDRLGNWSDAPGARFCHPREEHLMPLHVCYGVASAAGLAGENIYREKLMGFMTSGFRWLD